MSGVGAEGGVAGTIIFTGGAGGVGGAIAGAGGTTGGAAGSPGGTCLECVTSSCPTASECFANAACVQGIFCGLAGCTGTDPTALECWLDCFNGDATVAFTALQAALCLGQNCAMACQSLTP